MERIPIPDTGNWYRTGYCLRVITREVIYENGGRLVRCIMCMFGEVIGVYVFF